LLKPISPVAATEAFCLNQLTRWLPPKHFA
jgi:hypothetical protein